MQDAICVLAEVFTMPNVKVLNLQSRPDPNRGGEARIFMDMDASLDEPGMLSLLDYLESDRTKLRYLGTYVES